MKQDDKADVQQMLTDIKQIIDSARTFTIEGNLKIVYDGATYSVTF
jgi:hypothetical protein